jgi:threonine/homoserine/homoserine lactone efflux protein
MFEYSLLHWTTFFTAAVLLNLSPGPDISYILSHTVRGGMRYGLAAMLGIWTGAFGHALMAAVGLSAILATSSVAFSTVKWVGAAYLIWLGINALRSSGASYTRRGTATPTSLVRVFRDGVLVDALNPKVAIFFLAFLPQFVVEGAGPVWAQLLLHGILVIAAAALVDPVIIFLGSKIAGGLRRNQSLAKWFDCGFGAVLVALGLRLAVSDR